MLCRGHVIENLNGEEIALERFMKKNYKKQVKQSLKLRK